MANTVAKVRFVKCPKCLKLLPEFADIPMYRCGGCGTVLRGKYYNICKGSASSGSRVTDPSQGISDNESSDHSSISSNADNYCHEKGESSGNIEKRESSDVDGRDIEERNSDNTNIHARGIKDEDRSIQAKTEYSFSEDEEEDNSLNLSERGSDTLRSCHKSEALGASLSHSVASDEEILDEGRQSNSLSSPAVASSDNGLPDHVREKYHLMSRRTFRPQRGSSSGCSNIDKEKRISSLGSESFYSIQSSIESEKEESYFRRGESTSTKLKNLNQNRSELLNLVEELKQQLGRSYELKEEKKRMSQFSRPNPLLPTFFNHDRRSQQWPQRYQPSQKPLSYLHCHLQPDFCCNNSSFGTCSHNSCCHSSKTMGPTQYLSSAAASSYSHKSRPAKRFFRPVLGGAPFVTCYKCLETLHIPADFLISTNRLNKLKCGACSEILLLSFPAQAHPLPQVSADNVDSLEGPVSFSDGISFAESCSTETGPAMNTSRVPSDESRNVNSPGLPLHRVMGYPSARELLY